MTRGTGAVIELLASGHRRRIGPKGIARGVGLLRKKHARSRRDDRQYQKLDSAIHVRYSASSWPIDIKENAPSVL
jgi:hypothetical protein